MSKSCFPGVLKGCQDPDMNNIIKNNLLSILNNYIPQVPQAVRDLQKEPHDKHTTTKTRAIKTRQIQRNVEKIPDKPVSPRLTVRMSGMASKSSMSLVKP